VKLMQRLGLEVMTLLGLAAITYLFLGCATTDKYTAPKGGVLALKLAFPEVSEASDDRFDTDEVAARAAAKSKPGATAADYEAALAPAIANYRARTAALKALRAAMTACARGLDGASPPKKGDPATFTEAQARAACRPLAEALMLLSATWAAQALALPSEILEVIKIVGAWAGITVPAPAPPLPAPVPSPKPPAPTQARPAPPAAPWPSRPVPTRSAVLGLRRSPGDVVKFPEAVGGAA
jgi:hypothetical protein